MRIKGKITVQNDTESDYLFRHDNRGGCNVNQSDRWEGLDTLTSTKASELQ